MRKFFVVLLSILTLNSLFSQNTKRIVLDNNKFAFRLFYELQSKHNLFFSPFSISSALAMTYAGANANTKTEMSSTLCFNQPIDSMNQGFLNILKTLISDSTSTLRIKIANSLWAQNKFHFLDSYFSMVKNYYLAESKNIDFADASSENVINKWVEQKTNSKIKDLLPDKSIDANTKLILVNAIYFYGEWSHKFNENATKKEAFYLNSKDSVSAYFMNSKESLNYFEDSKFQIVELPYSSENISMFIFLPVNIKSFKHDFTNNYYSKAMSSLMPYKVSLSLPKFKMVSSFDLSYILKKIGMPQAFTSAADFSGMTGNKELLLSKVLHKTFIEVTENGTEATAATAVTMKVTSTAPSPVKTMKVNRPFAFIIRDNKTESILFMGQINNPLTDN